jgi:hypothetical protein
MKKKKVLATKESHKDLGELKPWNYSNMEELKQ